MQEKMPKKYITQSNLHRQVRLVEEMASHDRSGLFEQEIRQYRLIVKGDYFAKLRDLFLSNDICSKASV